MNALRIVIDGVATKDPKLKVDDMDFYFLIFKPIDIDILYIILNPIESSISKNLSLRSKNLVVSLFIKV